MIETKFITSKFRKDVIDVQREFSGISFVPNLTLKYSFSSKNLMKLT